MPDVSRRFQKVPEGSGMFRKVIEELEMLRCFWKLPLERVVQIDWMLLGCVMTAATKSIYRGLHLPILVTEQRTLR